MGDRSYLILPISFNIRSEIWRRSLIHHSIFGLVWPLNITKSYLNSSLYFLSCILACYTWIVYNIVQNKITVATLKLWNCQYQ